MDLVLSLTERAGSSCRTVTQEGSLSLLLQWHVIHSLSLGIRMASLLQRGHCDMFFSDPPLFLPLRQILSRCDISAVQEVRDSKGLAIRMLLQELNRYQLIHLESKRLGQGSYKEQNVFVYRVRGAHSTILPYYLNHYHSPAAIEDFVLLLHHASPREAAHELDLLFGVCLELMQRWKTENVMVLGDLNAAGAYIPASAWARIRLRTHHAFHWLIGDKEDTTVSHRTCYAYDSYALTSWGPGNEACPVPSHTVVLFPARIIVHGEELFRAVVPRSAKPFNFTRALGLSEDEVSSQFIPLRYPPQKLLS
uniref:Endonuclease/exonuclease/phosphatase domain-containing protein n=1 Tax=Varanus komodoensis TaxID=61221 RepID=A0A8D2Q8V0_VARKO